MHHLTHFHKKEKREKGAHEPPHSYERTLLWANHLKLYSLSQVEGRRTPSITVQNLEASDYFGRHPMTYIRCQSHVILGLVCAYITNLGS